MNVEKEDMQRVQDAVNTLTEHFDAVQIFVNRHEPNTEDGTIAMNLGAGNWYARHGQIAEWMVKHEERARQTVRAEVEE